ncbi:tetratricopeptide repeat protein, partial [Streptomyces adustus]|uniref:tetratricopeptide repeat protein n=1 Tax=Streptomyces adustus TaxID=1609272 RepID=UPI003710A49C
ASLGGALSNLGMWLAVAGRLDEAVAVTEEAVVVLRRVAAGCPAAHEASLGGALSNLGMWLAVAGRLDEAVAVTEEAVVVLRRVAAQHPAAYEANLATALAVMSWTRHQAQQDLPRAQHAATEAVQRFRTLADERPERFADLVGPVSTLRDTLAREDKPDGGTADFWAWVMVNAVDLET